MFTTEAINIPFPGKDHDAFAFSDTAFAVVDGATQAGDDWPDDLKEFAQAIADGLVAAPADLTLEDVWRTVITDLHESFPPAGYRRTAGAAFARIRGHRMEFSTLGDVEILISTGANVIRLLDPRLPALDTAAGKAGVWTDRKLANTTDGYWVVGDDPSSADHTVTLSLDATVVTSFSILSDGASPHLSSDAVSARYSLFRGGSLAESFERVRGPLKDDCTIIRAVKTRAHEGA